MIIGVMLKGALKTDHMVVMPLDTAFVKPEAEDIKRFCLGQLSSFYPNEEATGTCEILEFERVVAKIKSAQELRQASSRAFN